MIKLLLAVMALFLFYVNVISMLKKPAADSSLALTKADVANERWKEIGRIYQFISMPAQWLVFSTTLTLSYFSLINKAEIYFSIAILIVIFFVLILSKPNIDKNLSFNKSGVEYITKTIKLAMRASISLSIVIYLLCIGI